MVSAVKEVLDLVFNKYELDYTCFMQVLTNCLTSVYTSQGGYIEDVYDDMMLLKNQVIDQCIRNGMDK